MLFHRCAAPRAAFLPLRARSLALRVASKRKRIRRADPTQTATLRAKYEAAMVRRFRALKRSIHETIVDNDAFGLNVQAAARGAFAFPRSGDQVAAFMEWLRREARAGILQVRVGTPLQSSARNSWQNIYLESAYQRGILQAGREMRGAGGKVSNRWIGAAFNRPIHADAVGLIFTRAYGELEGVTDAMAQAISRALARGMAEGRGMRDLARMLEDEVDGIGIARARTLARTETISAHAEASLNSYEEAGIEGVDVEAEFSTAGDEQVCPDCQDLEGNVMSLDDARGVIPVHPNSYSDDTELYTADGWKLVSAIKPGEQCLSLNPKNFDLGYQPVVKTYAHEEPKMVHFHSRNFDLLVTPDHDVFCRRRERAWTKYKEWGFIKAADVPKETMFYRSSEWKGNDADIVKVSGQTFDAGDFAEFMGWWLSEGSGGGGPINIAQSRAKNPEKHQNIFDLCARMFGNRATATDHVIRVRNPAVEKYLAQFGKSYEKYIPVAIKQMSARHIRRFLSAYAAGDGHARKGNEFKGAAFKDEILYTTSSKKTADDLGELLIKVGHRPSYYLAKRKGLKVKHRNGTYVTNHDIWYVRECYGQTSQICATGIKKETVAYGRMTYCVELPEWHTLLVRRNGKVTWCGNCRCAFIPVIPDASNIDLR